MLWKKKLSYADLFGFREYSKYTERLATIKEYKKDFNKKIILDVGCGKNFNFLKRFFGKKYFGLDLISYKKKNFINHNINSKKLPFKNNSVPNVICTDVLEHVDNPHLLLKELFRISSETVIVSLPNNWPTFYLNFIFGTEIKKKVGYGLFEKPQPKGPLKSKCQRSSTARTRWCCATASTARCWRTCPAATPTCRCSTRRCSSRSSMMAVVITI
jgi:ubiquinone/menaquinone biosynthesis C-methylase UbiE